MIKYIKRKLKTTTGLMMGVMVTLSLVLGVSYSTFVITTDKYKASEMLISELIYKIEATSVENASISGTEVTVQSGKIGIVNVTITSLNEIDSKYSLEYKIKSGSGKVTYLGSSTYEPTGSINKNGTSVYTKTITIGIAATSTMKIEFNVSGGYTYNSIPTTLVGYTKITRKAHIVKVTSTNTDYGTVDHEVELVDNGGKTLFGVNPKPGYEYASNTCGGIVFETTLETDFVTSNTTCIVTFAPTLKTKILADNDTPKVRTDFSTTLGSETPTDKTIYKASGGFTEDGSEVYYFAGNVSNNWVKFGKDKDNNDLYWRIIRTNEDGGVRLLYAGTSPSTTTGHITVDGTTGYSFQNRGHVGYMHGTDGSLANNRLNTNSSNAKTAIDTWYSKGLNVKTDTSGNTYDKYVSRTAIYCNDRSGDSYTLYDGIRYAAYNRLVLSNSPSYRCGMKPDKSGLYSDANVADKFTAEAASKQNKIGNGQLTYPVALITADEIAMAGAKYRAGNYIYINLNSEGKSLKNGNYGVIYTMTPSTTDELVIDSYMFVFPTLTEDMIDDGGVLRPVLSLKSCVTVKEETTGTSSKPYEVSVNSTCASKEN